MTEPIALIPNTDAMAEFLEHAFGGYLDGLHNGLIEIACCSNQGDKPNERWWSHLFGTDEIDEAVAYASEQNEKRNNVYFAPALRSAEHPRNQRGNKAAVIGTLLLWAEWDDAETFDAARKKFQFTRPTAGVVTGLVPGRRAQAFWRLQTAIVSSVDIDNALNGLCTVLGGDPKVVHADCLMRMPGSVSWRKINKPERIDELTGLTINQIPSYPVEQIAQAYPPLPKQGDGVSYAAPAVMTRLGLSGQIQDGREGYMRNTILACLIEFIGVNGTAPTATELFQAAWPQYSSNVDFSRPGRGEAEFRVKCTYTAQRFTTGRIPGLPSLESAVEAYRKKKSVAGNVNAPGLPTSDLDDEPFQASSLKGIPPARKWLVPDWLPAGHVTSFYGDGGTGKSLLALQLANSMAAGLPWLGLDVPCGKVLGVFAEDDREEIWRRQYSIERASGDITSENLDNLYLWPRVGYDNLLQIFEAQKLINALTPFYERLRQRIEAIQPALVILDTAADIFGGEENVRAQVNHFIKATLGALCVRYGTTVLMLAQPSQSGMNSGRGDGGSTAWNNAVRSRWFLTKPEGATADERVLSRMKANYAAAGEDQKIPLLWEEGVFKVNTVGPQVISGNRANEILNDVQKAFDQGNPFGAFAQSERPLLNWMMQGYDLKRETCKEWIAAWLANGVVVSQRCGRNSRKSGLTVIKRPGDAPGE